MKFELFAELTVFTTFYSCIPFYFLELFQKFINHFPFLDDSSTIQARFFILHSLAATFFMYYHYSGFRTRYIIWHLERQRRESGYNPLELSFWVFYQSVFLCIGTELILVFEKKSFLDPRYLLWYTYTWNRFTNIVFLSLLEHTFLEVSGINDRLRVNFFEIDRD